MFQCPMCRQVANLDASVSMESLLCNDTESDNVDEDGDADILMDFSKGLIIEGGGIIWGGDNGGGVVGAGSSSIDQKKEKKQLSEQEKADMSIENLERASRDNAERMNAVSINSEEITSQDG
ncbi:hypothetical protein HK100_004497 [Physocladia obscura]|uniref:Uncharacterized protein n=1 Tax=Physocladia obscura TaxID=109957 RepID=A0AAD5XJ31_9FUNG|nr:hypothetical protein HK100_004497 [Physocladia obscura]